MSDERKREESGISRREFIKDAGLIAELIADLRNTLREPAEAFDGLGQAKPSS